MERRVHPTPTADFGLHPGPAGPRQTGPSVPGSEATGDCLSSTSALFLLVFLHVKLVQHGSGQGLCWVWAGPGDSFLAGKQTGKSPPALSSDWPQLCCSAPPLSLTSLLSLGTIYRLLIF